MATFSVPLKTSMLDICSSIKKFNEDTTTIKELIFSSPLLFKKHTRSVRNVWRQPVTEAMFTRDRSRTDPVRFSDRIGLLFTRDRSGTSPERIQNWTCKTAGPVLDPFRTGSRTVPCKQKPIRSGLVRNGSGPVPCKRSLRDLPYSAGSTQMVSLPSTTTVFSASYWRSLH